MNKLIEKARKARASKTHGNIFPDAELMDRIELAIAVGNGELTSNQVGAALECPTNQVNVRLGSFLMTGLRNGLITIQKVNNTAKGR